MHHFDLYGSASHATWMVALWKKIKEEQFNSSNTMDHFQGHNVNIVSIVLLLRYFHSFFYEAAKKCQMIYGWVAKQKKYTVLIESSSLYVVNGHIMQFYVNRFLTTVTRQHIHKHSSTNENPSIGRIKSTANRLP